MKTFYDVLNVSEDASIEEINQAYNSLKEKYRAYLLDPFNSAKAEEKIKKLDLAYQVLGNSERKGAYDKDLANMRNNELMSKLQKNTNTHNEKLKQEEENQRKEEEAKKAHEEKLRAEKLEKEKQERLRFVQAEIEKQIQNQKKQYEIEQKNRDKIEKEKQVAVKAYLKKMGVLKESPIKRFVKTILATIIVLGIVALIFQIPVVKNTILENEFIKSIFNI